MRYILITLIFFAIQLTAETKIEGTVYKVSSGDTFYFKSEEGKKIKVRLINTDAPDTKRHIMRNQLRLFQKSS